MKDLSALPPPQIIETVSFEVALLAIVERAVELFQAYGVAYDAAGLETDPLRVIMEAAAFREGHLRARINDAIKANLLAFALGSDLDHLAAFHDVDRLAGEGDEALRARTVLAIQARSPGGSAYWYRAAALRTDVRIRDVVVYREPVLPIIHVAVFSSENGGIPDAAMLVAVSAELQSDRVRLINDTIIVESAVSQTVDIEADVWLLPDAPLALVDTLEPALRAAWFAEAGVGFNLERSWIEARLHRPGIRKIAVAAPVAAVTVPASTAIALGEIHLTFRGRDY